MIRPWGYHVSLDCSGCNPVSMQNELLVRAWIGHLVDSIGMTPVGAPIVLYTAGDQADKAGFTVIQVIVTSSITAHFVDAAGHIYLDVFSCQEFSTDTVQASVRNAFGCDHMRVHSFTRSAG
jgi:S-adenosylmethionine/arginine decarboxylase-like enzyme